MKKAFLPLAILMVVILLVSACGKTTSTSTTTTTPSIKPNVTTGTSTTTTTTSTSTVNIKKGGTLRIIYALSPNSIPGWPGDTTNAQKVWMCWTVFEPLARLGSNGEPIPWLATKWDWGPEKKYITFTLRQGVKFSDGTDFTSASVKLQIDQLIADKDENVTEVDSCEAVDTYTVRINLKVYQTNFWARICNWSMFFVSDTVLKQGVEYAKLHPVGTGPFLYESFEKDVHLTFVKNPNYWQTGKPYLDGIQLITVKEELTQRAKLEADEGDMLALVAGKILQDMKAKGFDVIAQYGGTNFLIFDTSNANSVTNDPNIRMAIEYAINKKEMVDALGYGYQVVNNQISPPGNPSFYKDLPSRDYNPAKAKELLKAAGYETGLKLKLICISPATSEVYLQQYLKAVNIDLELEMVDNAKFFNYLFTGWTGMLSGGYSIPTNYPSFVLTYFPPGGTWNIGCMMPQDIVDKAKLAIIETDSAKFQAMSNELIQMVYDRCFFVPIGSSAMGHIVKKNIKDSGLYEYVDFSVWDPQNTWIDK